jgi:3-oxoadipate enol-lactonase
MTKDKGYAGADATARAVGEREYEALIGLPPRDSLAELHQTNPQLFATLVEGAFGGPLAHADLSREQRELATVAIAAAVGGAERQLATHAAAALRAGLGACELRALAEHVAVYAGFPRALNANAVIARVLDEQGVPRPPALERISLGDHETLVGSHGSSGPPVILLHALGLDWRMWEPVMSSLARGRRVFAYDLRGHGSARSASAGYMTDRVADDLLGVMDRLGFGQAHVVGLSYGGGIAQTAALRAPERFESLALLATTDFPFDAFEARAHSGEVDGMEAQVIPSLTRWFTPAALATNGWGVRYAREQVRRGEPTQWAAAWRAFQGLDVEGRLVGFPAPVLVLAGELDASTTPEIMSAIAERIPGSSYEELPAVPHMQTLERPELVAEALDRFIPSA